MLVHKCDRCGQIYNSYGEEIKGGRNYYSGNAVQFIYEDVSDLSKRILFRIVELCPECHEALESWLTEPDIEYEEKRVKE